MLAVGDRFIADFETFCHEGWKTHADSRGLDLIVFDVALDDSARARSRGEAWQMCLAVSHPKVLGNYQIACVDANNPRSPDIVTSVPAELV